MNNRGIRIILPAVTIDGSSACDDGQAADITVFAAGQRTILEVVIMDDSDINLPDLSKRMFLSVDTSALLTTLVLAGILPEGVRRDVPHLFTPSGD
jgi:hypothetical protein